MGIFVSASLCEIYRSKSPSCLYRDELYRTCNPFFPPKFLSFLFLVQHFLYLFTGVNESQVLNGVSALDYAACCGSEDLVRWKMQQQQGQGSTLVARRAAEVAEACGAEEVLR